MCEHMQSTVDQLANFWIMGWLLISLILDGFFSYELQVDEHRVVSVPYQSVKVLSWLVFVEKKRKRSLTIEFKGLNSNYFSWF